VNPKLLKQVDDIQPRIRGMLFNHLLFSQFKGKTKGSNQLLKRSQGGVTERALFETRRRHGPEAKRTDRPNTRARGHAKPRVIWATLEEFPDVIELGSDNSTRQSAILGRGGREAELSATHTLKFIPPTLNLACPTNQTRVAQGAGSKRGANLNRLLTAVHTHP
jgi:hypothetical protein